MEAEMDVATLMQEEQDGWSTPTRRECRIPSVEEFPPPPPPKKKPFTFGKKRPLPPKNGVFLHGAGRGDLIEAKAMVIGQCLQVRHHQDSQELCPFK
ncbi:hypothetical protein V6N13_076434 [Hibiscus sabdariffa]|uniref:Uncharacterized protein n=1 Tax=Hibiscus sabdariffa TaxID=183260 RepID=A0ABR2ABI2_9ROSI